MHVSEDDVGFRRIEPDSIHHSGAAIWTVLITKNDFLNIVKVQGGRSLGIKITAGPALCTLRRGTKPGNRFDWKTGCTLTSDSFPYRLDMGRFRLLRDQYLPLRARCMHLPEDLDRALATGLIYHDSFQKARATPDCAHGDHSKTLLYYPSTHDALSNICTGRRPALYPSIHRD